jgi:hypothetical protein
MLNDKRSLVCMFAWEIINSLVLEWEYNFGECRSNYTLSRCKRVDKYDQDKDRHGWCRDFRSFVYDIQNALRVGSGMVADLSDLMLRRIETEACWHPNFCQGMLANLGEDSPIFGLPPKLTDCGAVDAPCGRWRSYQALGSPEYLCISRGEVYGWCQPLAFWDRDITCHF